MLEYIKKNSGLISYEFVRGLVSDSFVDGSTFFKSYVDVLYKEKEMEDLYKETKDVRYNKPYREVVKLLLNSVTGKMNEDPPHYFRIKYDSKDDHINKVYEKNKPDLRRSKHLRMIKGECTHFAYSVLSRYF